MIYKLVNRKVISFLGIVLIIIVAFLWHKQETINKIIPKKASFVRNTIEWSRNYA